MNPARAMGTFLRTWRAEWAHLSRAQLALAVAARCQPPRKVTPDIIREWEDGQPPASTAELDALLHVMRRRGLTGPEVDQFRSAVFAACLDRHYPGLVDDGGFAHRADVDEVALACRWATDTVRLVGMVGELGGAVRSPRGHVSASQVRRQQAALACLRETLAERHECAARFALAVPLYAANAECLNANFGPRGLGGYLTPLYQLRGQLYASHAVSDFAGPSSRHRAGVELRRVLRLAERARSAGDHIAWFQGLYGSLTQIGHLTRPEMEATFAEAEAQLSWAQDAVLGGGYPPFTCLASGAIQLGLFGKAEQYLVEFDGVKHLVWEGPFMWLMQTAHLARYRGAFAEAQTYCEAALAYVEDELRALNVRRELEAIERDRHAAGHPHAKPRKPARPAAKQP